MSTTTPSELLFRDAAESSSVCESNTANLPAKPSRRNRLSVSLSERAAYTPAEFAALHGRSITWGYRQIYAGRVCVITGLGGSMMIPASEVARIHGEAQPMTMRRQKRAAIAQS